MAAAYTTGEGYTLDYWIKLMTEMESMGADSVCIKDMAGILTPSSAEELIRAAKKNIKIPVHLHRPLYQQA